MKNRKFWQVFIVCLVLVGMLTGCGSSEASAEYKYAEDIVPEVEMDNGLGKPEDVVEATMPANQKLIRRVRISAETENMDPLLTDLEKRLAELGGYVEERDISSSGDSTGTRKRAELTVRVPAENLNAFVNNVSEAANVTSINETTEDITLNYVATESRIKALETEEARLLELLAEAETMDDLLVIESRLTDVRYELEQVNSTLRLYDNQVNFATVYLTITKVQTYTQVQEAPEGFFARAWQTLCNVCSAIGRLFQELGIILIGSMPIWLPCLGGFFVWRYFRKRKKKEEKK